MILAALSATMLPVQLCAQTAESATQSLLDKAHALEVRGRMDMAVQTWQQVLLADPVNVDALAGLARAAKLSGNTALAGTYLDRLRAINANDPNIARIEKMGSQQDQATQLQQAGKYAQSGQYAQAMAIYRQVFGSTPPPGDWALAYYETESATEDGRAHAIAGLRALV
jgi:tetratricopeptide (TPR) repeat protein